MAYGHEHLLLRPLPYAFFDGAQNHTVEPY